MSAPWSPDVWQVANKVAASAHLGQCVPGGDLPYLLHVTQVAQELAAALAVDGGDGDLAVQCALLHDTIEDTSLDHGQLEALFGAAVADGVDALTKKDGPTKEARMEDSLRRIQQQPREVWMVKLADRITNLQPPPSHWTGEKRTRYRAEARRILAALGEASPYLAARLERKIEEYAMWEEL